jgi:hypothetical protein
MGTYRESRNVEGSIISFIQSALISDGWKDVRVEKTFGNVYVDSSKPCILVQEINTGLNRFEIGNSHFLPRPLININIFAMNDGQRLDLKDWLIEKLENGVTYYEYVITDGKIDEDSTEPNGRINILRFVDNRKVYENSENVMNLDKYRHLISFECRISKIV